MSSERKTLNSNNVEDVREWLSAPGNNFCAVPFSHMAIEANGSLRPCCVGLPFVDPDSGEPISARNHTIAELWNHPVRQELVESFRRNEQHPLCSACWTQGKFENRLKFSTNISTHQVTQSYMDTGKLPEERLLWLEIKPGNRCNLACRICGLHNSSRWSKPDWQAKRKSGVKNPEQTTPRFSDSWQFKHQQECDWIDVTPLWLDSQGLENIDMIHFMGGEPMMVPEHFELLKNLILDPNTDTTRITIRYNTNGTMYPTPEQLAILKQFRRVIWLLSIDDIGRRFEYQRYGDRWANVETNVARFLEEFDKQLVSLDPTVSMFNAFYLDEYVEWAESIGIDAIESLGETYHMVKTGSNGNKDVRNLPLLSRAVLKDRLLSSRYSHIPLLRNTVKWLDMPKDEKIREQELRDTCMYTQIIDQQRKQDIGRDHARMVSVEPLPWDTRFAIPTNSTVKPK